MTSCYQQCHTQGGAGSLKFLRHLNDPICFAISNCIKTKGNTSLSKPTVHNLIKTKLPHKIFARAANEGPSLLLMSATLDSILPPSQTGQQTGCHICFSKHFCFELTAT